MSQNVSLDEIVDVVDQDNMVVGTQSRNEIYKNGLDESRYIRYVYVFLFNLEGRMLLSKRSADRRVFPGLYDFSCGEHVASAEPNNGAVIRGLTEELGILNPGLEVLGKLGPQDGVSGFMSLYRVLSDLKHFDYDKERVQSLEWFKRDEVEAMIKENPTSFKPDFIPAFEWYCKSFSE